MAALSRCALDAVTAALEETPPLTGAALRRDLVLVDEMTMLLHLAPGEAEALRAAYMVTRLGSGARARLVVPEQVAGRAALAERLRAGAAAVSGAAATPAAPQATDDLGRLIATALSRAATRMPPHGTETPALDPLTRLPLLPFLFGSFEQDLRRAARLRAPLSLIQIDIDGFRGINERYGRDAGDRVLRGVARAIRSTLRPGDTCVRATGDEFIVTVPGVGGDGVAAVVARIEAAVLRHKFAVTRGRSIQVGVTAGAAAFPADGATHEALLAIAEARRVDRLLARRPRPEDAGKHLRFPGRPDVPVN